jgi:hypothetical protein
VVGFGWFWGWGTSDMRFSPVRLLALKYYIAVVWHGKKPCTYRRDRGLRDSYGAPMQQSKSFEVVFLRKVQKNYVSVLR